MILFSCSKFYHNLKIFYLIKKNFYPYNNFKSPLSYQTFSLNKWSLLLFPSPPNRRGVRGEDFPQQLTLNTYPHPYSFAAASSLACSSAIAKASTICHNFQAII
ncbi:MAG: hypothetical protein LBQ24_07780 [Candidatus Peribacteria bacterium]|jgi:hypothetical protein|nr:hypothetical protein [Candidatus Peribacteria bacterium]